MFAYKACKRNVIQSQNKSRGDHLKYLWQKTWQIKIKHYNNVTDDDNNTDNDDNNYDDNDDNDVWAEKIASVFF